VAINLRNVMQCPDLNIKNMGHRKIKKVQLIVKGTNTSIMVGHRKIKNVELKRQIPTQVV
jgi:hypothetical protein